MKKISGLFFCFLLLAGAGQLALAQKESNEGKENGQEINKKVKKISKEVAKESKKIFRKTGAVGKSFWQGMKEGFKETK